MKKIVLVFIIAFTCCLAIESHAGAQLLMPPMFTPTDYREKAPIVDLAANFSGKIVGVVGIVGAIPYVMVSGDTQTPYSAFAKLGYHAVGAPLYLVRKIIWETPCRLYDLVFGSNESPPSPPKTPQESEPE